VLSTGRVVCWGEGDNLGAAGSTSDNYQAANVDYIDGSTARRDAAEVSSGYQHTCARMLNGSVMCWGWNRVGQIGDGTTTYRRSPTMVKGLNGSSTGNAKARDLECGGYHCCALMDNPTGTQAAMKCWGESSSGQVAYDQTDTTPDAYKTTPQDATM
jgi:alpha-tubulin suppressor-like RCC1 family protein